MISYTLSVTLDILVVWVIGCGGFSKEMQKRIWSVISPRHGSFLKNAQGHVAHLDRWDNRRLALAATAADRA